MSSDNSPGPWHAERRNGFHVIVDSECEVVAQVPDVMAGDGGYSNARLIAAGPELLAACDEEVATCGNCQDLDCHEHEAMRAALAKAGAK